jgi:hypothetical protein
MSILSALLYMAAQIDMLGVGRVTTGRIPAFECFAFTPNAKHVLFSQFPLQSPNHAKASLVRMEKFCYSFSLPPLASLRHRVPGPFFGKRAGVTAGTS